ncbi:hypothetical protein BJP41_01070 [Candidatus Williamhamiltonella defendens]|uniref:Uncharacterized protein n=1 Tax=Candidatus Williamhamiltonella defendens TaxID=138072 RepID=A0A2D3T5S9_9ENTR|nr:hypothetical protein CJJ18_07270 [Candidatus Hamiltonella defensa]ATW29167.1 hypothetical protein BJP41_01070 [Candidatus Hamiltonella defensa]ATW31146.1 hypothetical protein BJP42_01160 [Candidatus Hamiltonella defensa]ATW33156.1 hypothetical protein BJP43_01405 [Candidatus Hamiltonella defensa]AWK16786.1 hypothetical protein CCS40_07100 [Candidatus Hamiltonella defensa]
MGEWRLWRSEKKPQTRLRLNGNEFFRDLNAAMILIRTLKYPPTFALRPSHSKNGLNKALIMSA